MQFPNEIQAALLFDRPITCLEDAARAFMQFEGARTGARFNMPEANPGVFYRLFGGDDLMITLEYLNGPANMAVFQQPLASAVTGIYCADIRERLAKCRSHILVNVSHGVLGGVAQDPKIAALLQQAGMPPEGHSLPQFRRRLDVLGQISRIICDRTPAQVIHWTQSNQLMPGETFTSLATAEAPSPLHIHPYLYGNAQGASGKPEVGIRTFGARHFIGREVVVEPNVLPWAANFATILALLRIATTENGYIIPHGDTFGPENDGQSYRVFHHNAKEGDVPLLKVVPLLYRQYGFQAQDYVPRQHAFDDRNPPPELMPVDLSAGHGLINEWREKRALAEGIGGKFEVRVRGDGAPPPPSDQPPRSSLFSKLNIFGRRKS